MKLSELFKSEGSYRAKLARSLLALGARAGSPKGGRHSRGIQSAFYGDILRGVGYTKPTLASRRAANRARNKRGRESTRVNRLRAA